VAEDDWDDLGVGARDSVSVMTKKIEVRGHYSDATVTTTSALSRQARLELVDE
jgi:hypothetical protein